MRQPKKPPASDVCPAWVDGVHLYAAGFALEVMQGPFSTKVVGETFRALSEDDHRTSVKACRCGKMIRATRAFMYLKGKRGYIAREPDPPPLRPDQMTPEEAADGDGT